MSSTTTTVTTSAPVDAKPASTVAYNRVEASYAFRADNKIDTQLKRRIAVALGYSEADLARLPDDANIGESCGNPLAIAALQEGEKVVDLGSGGGYDTLLASEKVGPTGKVIGVDMTEKMITLGRENAAKANVDNVEFVQARIDQIPIEENSMDCVLSNCVLNLIPEDDKTSAIKEIHRVLRPCGRIAISDFLALKPLPAEMKNDPELMAGCVSGAIEVDVMEKLLVEIGFDDVLLVDTKKDLNLYKDGEEAKSVSPCCAGTGSCGPGISASGRKLLDYDLNEWISSFEIYGHKSCGKIKGPKQTVVMRVAASEEAPSENASIPLPQACSTGSGCC